MKIVRINISISAKKIATIIVLLFLSISENIFAQSLDYKPNSKYTNQTIWDIKNIKEEKIDIGLWALIIAKEYDNRVDVQKYLRRLDLMANEVKKMITNRNTDFDKLMGIVYYQFQSGPWNNNKIFEYDLKDPFGDNTKNKLLSTYLDKAKGNCISMPTLFLAIAERVDPQLKLFGALAPLHVFCSFEDRQRKEAYFIEPTNGGHRTSAEYYIDKLKIDSNCINNKLYLSSLSKSEYIAVLLQILIIKEIKRKNYEKALEYCNLAEFLAPKLLSTIVNKASICSWISFDLVGGENKSKFNSLSDLEKERAIFYYNESHRLISIAKEMGWKEESDEQNNQYLKSIQKEKMNKQKMKKIIK